MRHSGGRALCLALAAGLASMLVGDRARAIIANPGVDPLQILDLQVKPNVYIILDTSGSMREPFPNLPQLGGDDATSKMFRAKSALNSFLTNNATKYNFGFGSYNLRNTEKVLAYDDTSTTQPSNPLGGNQDLDGPMLYVTTDNPTTTQAGFWSTWFINQVNDANTNYLITPGLGTTPSTTESRNVYRSFELSRNQNGGGVPAAFTITGTSCTVEPCRRYLSSRLLRDGLVFKWNTGTSGNKSDALVSVTAITNGCPFPPVGLFPQDKDADSNGTTDLRRPCFQMETAGTPGSVSTWWYTSARWQRRDGLGSQSDSGCGGGATLENVAGCSNDNTGVIKAFLKPELPVDGSCAGTPAGFPCGVPVALSGTGQTTSTAIASTNPAGTSADTALGIIAAQYTPLGKSLDQVNTNRATIFPNQPGLPPGVTQPNVVILVTDGVDTCPPTSPVTAAATLRGNGIQTFVIGLSISSATLDAIAQAGSGTNAFAVVDEVALENALVTILTSLPQPGTFSDQQSITESVFELGSLISPQPTPAIDPLDPTTRFDATVPVLLQSIFEMPGYNGHLRAFRNVGGSASLMWDAGDMLCRRVTGYKAKTDAAGLPIAPCDIGGVAAPGSTPGTGNTGNSTSLTFATLVGNATAATVDTSTARIKRRIYTSSQNGINGNYTPQNLVNATATSSPATWGSQAALWPPDAAVDPAVSGNTYPTGSLDGPLGIASLTLAQLQTAFGACQRSTQSGSGVTPPDCGVTTGTPPRQEQIARKEAREMILAFTAGAEVVKGNDGLPMRDSTTAGNIRYKARTWIMAESSLAAPGVITPPLQSNVTGSRLPEYVLYRDGPRDTSATPKVARNLTYSGFGLRNPDDDSQTASAGDATLKPSMSLVLQPTNHMLHAFRAGPLSTSGGTCTPSATNECGGEELWAYVPYDQLGKLALRMRPQDRTNHTYVMASPVRFADVFVPGSFSKSFTGGTAAGAGVWRTVAVFGRGAGGKSLSGVDVTVPGPFTLMSLKTRPPVIVWNRGNPDTNDGAPKTGANSYVNNANDYNGYLKMGETWSTPAVGFATAANNVTTRKASGVEFVAWVGSGYSDVSTEGSSFFALDVLTGDVIGSSSQAAFTLAAGTSAAAIANSVPANTAAFAAKPLSFNDPANPIFAHPATEKVTAVYFPDLHSRVWKFNPDTPAAAPTLFIDVSSDGDQPMANGVALINANSDNTSNKPHVLFEAGNDKRVPVRSSAPFFRMYGYRDDASPPTALQNFPIDFPQGFRGTVQPATAFNANGKGRVFFGGTRFNPVTATVCASSFDSVLFALDLTGQAAYDLNSSGDDRSVTLTNQRVNAIQVVAGKLVVDMGLGAQNPPPPPQPPATLPPAPSPISNISVVSNVPGTIPFKLGSSVCR